ncbi:MAG: hypothetical protein ACFFDX_04850 [Candidatus Odinarchaeota archaeon]
MDKIGLVLTIIGAAIILPAITVFVFYYGMSVPVPFLRTLFRVIIIVFLVIGSLIFIIGIILRIVDRIQGKTSSRYSIKERKTENEVIEDIINYLKNNEGKAFTLKALMNRIYEENLIEINKNIIEDLLQVLINSNKIRSQFKDGEIFYSY